MFRQEHHEDWFMRQIELAARVLAAIIDKARSGKQLEALGMFDQAYQPLLGMSAGLLPYLPDTQLRDLLAPGGVPDANRWPFVVRLLLTEGDLYATQGDHGQAFARHRLAAVLAADLGGEATPDADLDAQLADRLRGYELDTPLRLLAARLSERAGRYADAEDTLFTGIDDHDADRPDPRHDVARQDGSRQDPEPLIEAAIAMYLRLLDKDDPTLAAGNLPRDEVAESLAELLARHPRA